MLHPVWKEALFLLVLVLLAGEMKPAQAVDMLFDTRSGSKSGPAIDLDGTRSNEPIQGASALQRLMELESAMTSSWNRSDRVAFKAVANEALAVVIPKALLQIAGEVTSALEEARGLRVLSPIFSILSIVADLLGLTVFSTDNEFADLYGFLQENFMMITAMIEENFHAIQALQKLIKCGETYSEVKKYKTEVNAFFERYKVMTERAKTDRTGALAIFDSELAQYQSAKELLPLRQLLVEKALHASLVANCAKGSLSDYTKGMVELYHTLQQAIILDMTAKIRLFNFTKASLDVERDYWRKQVVQVASLMEATATDLATKSWHGFYKSDADASLGSSVAESASAFDAAQKLNGALTQKYPYVRTAVIVIPEGASSVSVTDPFGDNMPRVNQDSFVCYRKPRGTLGTVIVFCRNQVNYPNEQAELNRAYAKYSRGILSVSLLDALRNNRWADIATIMSDNKVSFFAVTVKATIKEGSAVAEVQSKSADDMVFFHSDDTAFQALVVAKLIANQTRPFKPPAEVKASQRLGGEVGGLATITAGMLIAWHLGIESITKNPPFYF